MPSVDAYRSRIKMIEAQSNSIQSSRYDYNKIGKNSMATLKLNDKGCIWHHICGV
jgi:hypothetical protein